MYLREKENNGKIYSGDIEPRDIFFPVCLWEVVAIVFIIIGLFIAWSIVDDDYTSYRSNVKYAPVYNSLTPADRKALAEYYQYSNVDQESYYMTVEEVATPKEWFRSRIGVIVTVILAILYVAMAIATFVGYYQEKSFGYFYADFPEWWGQRWILPVMTLPFFWVYLISYCRMRRWIAKQAVKAEEHRRTWVVAKQPLVHPTIDRDADRQLVTNYATLHQEIMKSTHQRDLHNATAAILEAQQDIENARGALKKLEEKLLNLELERSALQEKGPKNHRLDEAEAFAELEEIRQMRGVVSVANVTKWDKALFLQIKIRFPAEDELYKIADAELKISVDDDGPQWKINLLSSGCEPKYHNSYFGNKQRGFCFGDGEAKIQQYLEAGEIVAAVNLIINSLHAIPGNRAANISTYYRRVVPLGEHGMA